MEILAMRDLIVDEYGNYYISISTGRELTLVNAFMLFSFNRLISFDDDFKKEFVKYERKYIGKIAMDILKDKIEGLKEGKCPGGIYKIEDVKKYYSIKIIPLYEK